MTRPEPLPDQWYSRDLPVLRQVARTFADNPTTHRVDVGPIADALGMDHASVAAIGEMLIDAGYVEGEGTDWGLAYFTKLTAAGRREVGLWPTPDVAADRLIAALQAAVDEAPEGPEKTRRQKIMDGVISMGREFIVGVATNMVSGG